MFEVKNPELIAALDAYNEALPNGYPLPDVEKSRAILAEMIPSATNDRDDVTTEDHIITSELDGSDITVRVYTPVGAHGPLPAVLWIHGGGYMLGSIEIDHPVVSRICAESGSIIVSVGYRLAPEHPYPIPLEDCYSALKWVFRCGEKLGVDTKAVSVAGPSAGGGLAAGLALLSRDRGEVALQAQLLIYPMIDDRDQSLSTSPAPVWPSEYNRIGWRSYLGIEPGSDGISEYAAPARADNLEGLPITYICVGTADLFLKENMAYAARLIDAGVRTDLHVYESGFHGFDLLDPNSTSAKRFTDGYISMLRRLDADMVS